MTDRMKHRFQEELKDWLDLLWEMGALSESDRKKILGNSEDSPAEEQDEEEERR